MSARRAVVYGLILYAIGFATAVSIWRPHHHARALPPPFCCSLDGVYTPASHAKSLYVTPKTFMWSSSSGASVSCEQRVGGKLLPCCSWTGPGDEVCPGDSGLTFSSWGARWCAVSNVMVHESCAKAMLHYWSNR